MQPSYNPLNQPVKQPKTGGRSPCPPPFQAHLYWKRSPLSGSFLDWKMLPRLAGSPLVYWLESPRRTACLMMHLAPSDL